MLWGGDGVGRHWTLLNIFFLMCTFLRMAKSGGMRTPAHSDCFLLLISCFNKDLHSKVLPKNPPKRSCIIPNSWWLEYRDNRNFWTSRYLETRNNFKKLQNHQLNHILQRQGNHPPPAANCYVCSVWWKMILPSWKPKTPEGKLGEIVMRTQPFFHFSSCFSDSSREMNTGI